MIGTTVSHYKIEKKLGEGGMGVVYLGRDEKLERPVAIKTMPPHVSASRAQKLRFIQEAQAASALNHPNVATVYGIEETPEHTLIILEYIDGQTLLDLEKPVPIEDVLKYGTAVAEGLEAAHDAGIVHRDIKGENVMVTRDGRIKITDFGVAKLAGKARQTDAGARVGTLAYTSPEMIQGGDVDHRTDLWSFGVLLYELITGEPPFRGDYEAVLLYEILNAEPKAIQAYRDDVPEDLGLLVSRLLEKDPARRVGSAAEVLEMFRGVEAGCPPEGPREYSISVLYFENMSPDKENEYVCAGITEDIITDLSKISGLNVTSRTDVLPFRHRDVESRDLGESLGVDYVLEGSVRKSGRRLRITTQLTDVKSGFHVWAERFDCLVDDIFELQNEVARKVAEALKISLTDSEKETLARKPTEDVRAYDFYLRARELLSRRGRKRAEAAIEMLRNAARIDSGFVLAYTGLAEAYSAMYTYYDGGDVWLARVEEMSRKALELDPNLIEARFSMGLVCFHKKEFEKAREILEKVVEERPYFYDGYWWLGIIADITGRYDEALENYEMSAAIKPYSVEPWLYMNMTHRRRGDLSAAKLSAKRFLEVGLRKLEVNPDDAVTLSRFAVIYTLFGEHERANATLTRILESQPDDGLVLYNCASTYALLGDQAQSIRCLRMALESGFKNIREWIKSDPDFDILRNSETFAALIQEFEPPADGQ